MQNKFDNLFEKKGKSLVISFFVWPLINQIAILLIIAYYDKKDEKPDVRMRRSSINSILEKHHV